MQRHELIETMRELKLFGMVEAFDETVTQGVRKKHTVHEILSGLCKAEISERKARSIRYQMRIAKFPVLKDLDTFSFDNVPVEEMVIKGIISRAIFIGKPEHNFCRWYRYR